MYSLRTHVDDAAHLGVALAFRGLPSARVSGFLQLCAQPCSSCHVIDDPTKRREYGKGSEHPESNSTRLVFPKTGHAPVKIAEFHCHRQLKYSIRMGTRIKAIVGRPKKMNVGKERSVVAIRPASLRP